MAKLEDKIIKRVGRHLRIRKKVVGTPERPRLCVHRSLKNFYAQIVNDREGRVLLGMSTLNKNLRGKVKNGANSQAAAALGEVFAALAKKKGITRVSFDRGGYLYHGCVKAFAEAARQGGLEF